ncbi:GNAT family N-acetyltransferase [Bacillus sp. ISL-34]|uniref:GNAT family N-acetyltransferase n=1 Tax=Bacillus sp. ISL-34 TaxID=2819121 RepID=UPI0037BFE90E
MTAIGLGVLEDKYIGLYNIITHENFRNQGNGAILISNLLHWGKENGAKNAYLQVIETNAPALNLYRIMGFEEKYKYWYRIKTKE